MASATDGGSQRRIRGGDRVPGASSEAAVIAVERCGGGGTGHGSGGAEQRRSLSRSCRHRRRRLGRGRGWPTAASQNSGLGGGGVAGQPGHCLLASLGHFLFTQTALFIENRGFPLSFDFELRSIPGQPFGPPWENNA